MLQVVGNHIDDKHNAFHKNCKCIKRKEEEVEMFDVVCAIQNGEIQFDSDLDVQSLLSQTGAEEGSLSGVEQKVDEYGAGIFNIGKKGGVYIGAIALLAFFAGLALHHNNANKRAEKKDAIGPLLMGVGGMFAVTGLIIFLQNIGSSIF